MVVGTGEKIGTGEGGYLDEALLREIDVEDEDLVLSVGTSLERLQIVHTILYEPQLLSGHSSSWRDLTDCARLVEKVCRAANRVSDCKTLVLLQEVPDRQESARGEAC
jgi:hypothetical protein